MIAWTETLYNGTATGSDSTQLTPIVSKYAKEATIFFEITAASGGSPTLDVTIQLQNPRTDSWHTLATFCQKTAVSTDVGYIDYGLGENMAINYAVGGSNPSFTFSVDVTFKDE